MKHLRLGAFALLLLFFVASCADSTASKGSQGAVGGAVGGALIGQAIGKSTEATLIGAVVGTMLGYIVGNEMDKFDRYQLNEAYEQGVSGKSVGWVNPDTGNSYKVVPQPAYSSNGRVCRQAEVLATIDGRAETTYATACRNSRGQWVLQ